MAGARLLALSFLAGAAVMTAEIAAPRLVAPHLGTTALVWTAVIATFLGGMALGSAWGGRWADGARPWVGAAALLAAAAATAAAVPLDALARATVSSPGLGVPHPARVLAGVVLAFAPAAVLLGTVGPVLGRAALRAGWAPGRALGAVAGAGAAGSVLGTFLAGFVLIPAAGTRAILLATAGALALGSLLAWRLDLGAPGERTPAPPGPPPTVGYGLLAALAGGVILALEIAMGRLASDLLGNSVYTWTSVIGVVLLGLAAGNALGGRLADRFAARRLLTALLLAASAAVASALWTKSLLRPIVETEALSWPARTLAAVAAAFLLPAVALGTLSPALVRAALADPRADGRTVGRLYALGSLGAVAGAVLAGFVLIPGRGVPMAIALLAFVLEMAHGRVRGRQEVAWLATLAAMAALIALPVGAVRDLGLRLQLREDWPGWYVEDSAYFRIRVQPTDARWMRLAAPPADDVDDHPVLEGRAAFEPERRVLHWRGPMSVVQAATIRRALATEEDRAALDGLAARTKHDVRVLALDKLVHGYVDLQDPRWLGYDYERLYAAVLRRVWPAEGPVRAFFIGGGSYTFQRRLRAIHGDGVACTTAEIDPAVTAAAEAALGLVPGGAGEVWHGDARTWVRSRAPGSGRVHLVFGDAFNDLSVPWHLTTEEFTRDLKERLDPEAYLVNVIDAFDSGRFLGAFVRTLERCFAHVAVLSVAPRNDDAQDTFVLVASDRPLDLTDLREDDGQPLEAVRYGPEDLAALRARRGPPVLTDDHAPVETLLAPVVRARGAR